jgi:hypothetical protein
MEKFSPKYFLIPDVFPISFLQGNFPTDKNIVLEKTQDYKLKNSVKDIFSDIDVSFLSSNLDLLNRSEASQYEKIT